MRGSPSGYGVKSWRVEDPDAARRGAAAGGRARRPGARRRRRAVARRSRGAGAAVDGLNGAPWAAPVALLLELDHRGAAAALVGRRGRAFSTSGWSFRNFSSPRRRLPVPWPCTMRISRTSVTRESSRNLATRSTACSTVQPMTLISLSRPSRGWRSTFTRTGAWPRGAAPAAAREPMDAQVADLGAHPLAAHVDLGAVAVERHDRAFEAQAATVTRAPSVSGSSDSAAAGAGAPGCRSPSMMRPIGRGGLGAGGARLRRWRCRRAAPAPRPARSGCRSAPSAAR